MNPITATLILFNMGYSIFTRPEGDTLIVSKPQGRTTVTEVENLLRPFNPAFITFTQLDASVEIYFHG